MTRRKDNKKQKSQKLILSFYKKLLHDQPNLGDCCGCSDYSFCHDCECKHDQQKLESDQFALGFYHNDSCKLAFADAMGDGFCHDELNDKYCDFDKGDCCKPLVWTNACNMCKCIRNENPYFVAETKQLEEHPCNFLSFVDDKHCQDDSNVPQCHYDGGDCCGHIDLTFCTECACFNPSQKDQTRGRP